MLEQLAGLVLIEKVAGYVISGVLLVLFIVALAFDAIGDWIDRR